MKPDIALLKKVLNLPTAPFHEEAVLRFALSFCRRLGLVCRQDGFGNLKIIYKKGKSKPVVFTAHMDHPGFEIIKGGQRPIALLLGGVPDKYFLKAKVLIWNNGKEVKGKVRQIFSKKRRQFVLQADKPVSKGAFGYFDLPGVQLRNGLIYTKAADNVASVAVLLNLLKELVQKKTKAHVICLFTRAEEVGFVGAQGAIRQNFISTKVPLIVLESSSAAAGPVQIGSGPVLRVGDRFSTFSHGLDIWLKAAAEELQRKDKRFQFQRALLPGGRCEASVYVMNNFQVGGVAFPLGNYHNVGPKNYAPEYISRRDYENMLKWLKAISQNPAPRQVLKKSEKSVAALFNRYQRRLEKIAG